MQGCLYVRSPLTLKSYICSGLMSNKPGKRICTELSFQMNDASIFGTMMASFVLDAMPINAAFHSALSNDIVAENSELWSNLCDFVSWTINLATN